MNIVIFTHYYYPHVGGIESVVRNHAKRLDERGHNITIVTTDIDSKSHSESQDGYNIIRYIATNFLEEAGVPYPIPNPLDCFRTARSVVDGDTDIIHVHGLNYLTSLFPLLALYEHETPIVLHQHTPFIDYSYILNIIEYLNDFILGRLVLRQADHCIAVSDNVSDYLENLGVNTVDVLYNGVDLSRFHPDVGETSDEVLYVGRLTQKKGINRLLKTVQVLENRGHTSSIRIVGKGDLTDEVQKMAFSSKILKFEGFVKDKYLPELYSRASALIVPNQTGDALPTLTILEALASGTPPILVEDEQLPPMFFEDENYLKAQPKPEGLADTIQRLFRNQERIETLTLNSRKTAEEFFNWEVKVDQLESLYEDIQRE